MAGGTIWLRVVLLAVLAVGTNLWLERHLGHGIENPLGLLGLAGSMTVLSAVLDWSLKDYEKEEVPYELSFPDTEENRMRILRFLLADHLADMPRRPLLDLFDRHSDAGQIRILTSSEHFMVRASRRPGGG